jgi:glycosyltransferase involved in cell wall biosynthesis
MGISVVVVDDNPHLRWGGATYPRNATFQHFAAALLDLPGRPVERLVACLPVAPASSPPPSRPLDVRIDVVDTEPFEGIADFLRRPVEVSRRNAPRLRAAIAEADLVWLKVPASNAVLAAWFARAAGRPRCVWVAGSAAAVAVARFSGPTRLGAWAVGAGYDLVGRLVGLGGLRIVVGEGLVRSDGSPGDGIVASLVEAGEVRPPCRTGASTDEGGGRLGTPGRPLRLVYAGRLAEGKGLEVLLEAVVRLAADGAMVRLDLVGDGPIRRRLEARAAAAELAGRVSFTGYLADRGRYLDRLAMADLFVHPSGAEGFPKVVLDAMAVGLPVVAVPAGQLAPLARAGIVEQARPTVVDLAAVIRALAIDPVRRGSLSAAGSAFVARHTRPAEAARLVAWWRTAWPDLPW